MWRFFVLFLVAFSLVAGAHYYIWLRLVRDLGLASPWRGLATGAVVLLGLSLPCSFLIQRALSLSTGKSVLWPIYVWMGLMFLLVALLALGDLTSLLLRAAARLADRPLTGERRRFLRQTINLASAAVAVGLGVWSVAHARRGLRVRRLAITLDRLPAKLSGTTIVQICDLHLGPTLGRDFVEEVVKTCNGLAPDVVAIVGDLVDHPVAELRDVVAPLAELRTRYGAYFVTGNHEYYISRQGGDGAEEWMAELERLGVRALRNQRVSIGERPEESYDLAGVEDWSARGAGHRMDLSRALVGRDAGRELVLLAHQPRAIFQAARQGVGLQLSGHTHGGQIWPWRYLVYLQQPYVAGLARHGSCQIYVSDGTGYWGPPMRLGTSGEVTHITLLAPAQPARATIPFIPSGGDR